MNKIDEISKTELEKYSEEIRFFQDGLIDVFKPRIFALRMTKPPQMLLPFGEPWESKFKIHHNQKCLIKAQAEILSHHNSNWWM